MIHTQPMSETQFAAFRPLLAEDYAQAIARHAGIPIAEARRDAERELLTLLPDGLATPNCTLHAVRCAETGEQVGYAFWGMESAKQRGFAYYLHVLPAWRGRGYGRAILRRLHDALREEGATHVVLNVFADNTVARTLYESSGYAPSSVTMVKRL